MLVAVGASGRRYTAGETLPEVPRCPDCGDEVMVRLRGGKVPHFAHYPHRRCTSAAARAARRRQQMEARRRARAARLAQVHEVTGQLGLFDLDQVPAAAG